MSKSKRTYILYGIFGIIILFVAYWGLSFLKGSSIFNKTYNYEVYYNHIEGLNTSSIVTINGYKVGQVTDIVFLPNNNQQLKVTLQISNDFLLPDSTIARIYSMDLLGSKAIELIFGNNTEKYHKDGDILIGEIEQSLKEQVSLQMLPIKNQAENLMKGLSNAIEILSYILNETTRDNLEKSFASIKNTLLHIEHASYEIDTMLISESSKISRIISNIELITRTLRDNHDQINNIIVNLSDFSDTLMAIEISKTILQANNILTKFDNIVAKVEKGEGTLGQLINDNNLYNELEQSAENLDRLLIDLRNNPKKYLNLSLINIGRTVNVSDDSELSTKDRKVLEKQKQKEEKQILKNIKKEAKKYNDNSDNITPLLHDSLFFMIQIKSTIAQLSLDSPEFKGYNEIIVKNVDNRYKYFLFQYSEPEQTEYYTALVREDFPDAFPVAFYQNKQITYSQAKELLSSR